MNFIKLTEMSKELEELNKIRINFDCVLNYGIFRNKRTTTVTLCSECYWIEVKETPEEIDEILWRKEIL